MRKLSILATAAAATLAIAAPAFAQPGYNGYDNRGYDQRSDQRGWNDYGRGVQRELAQLNNQVQVDFQRGIIGKKVAKAFFNRIRDLQRAEARARDKNGGRLNGQQSRDLQVAVNRVQGDLRQHEMQYGGGYGNRYDRRW